MRLAASLGFPLSDRSSPIPGLVGCLGRPVLLDQSGHRHGATQPPPPQNGFRVGVCPKPRQSELPPWVQGGAHT